MSGTPENPSAEDQRDTLSMSTDNTAAGRLSDIANAGPIALVAQGMKVVAASGKEIGKVEVVKMADANAVTASDREWANSVDPVSRAGYAIFGIGSHIPDDVRHRLLLLGYLLIDGKGWVLDRDYYAASDQIARVEGDRVLLSVNEDQLYPA